MLSQPGKIGRLDDQTGGVEAVEPREDEHQPHQGEMGVMGSEGSGPPAMSYFPMRGPRFRSTPSVKAPGHAVDDERRDRVVEAVVGRQPAARAPAPGGVHDPDRRAEQHREQQVRGEPDALDQRAGHDRARRPREEQEGEEEDDVDVVGEVRPELVRPRGVSRRRSRGTRRARRVPAPGRRARSSRRCTSRSSRRSA